jgi:hypothetical protein
MNIAEQISAFEAKRATLVAANTAIMEKAAGEGADLFSNVHWICP